MDKLDQPAAGSISAIRREAELDYTLRFLAIGQYVFGLYLAGSGALALFLNHSIDRTGTTDPLRSLSIAGILGGFPFLACGYLISARRGWALTLIVALITSVLFPFGTILGVATIYVLCRKGVRQIYTARASTESQTGR